MEHNNCVVVCCENAKIIMQSRKVLVENVGMLQAWETKRVKLGTMAAESIIVRFMCKLLEAGVYQLMSAECRWGKAGDLIAGMQCG